MIAELVADPTRQEDCFDTLYQHFAEPQNWRCYDDVAESLRKLHAKKLQLVIASNFDQRLHSVCAGLEDLRPVTDRIISSEVGWRKPAREFFNIVCERTDCRPHEILFVGDDPLNDIQGARLAGMPAAWIDRRGEPTGAVDPAAPPSRTDHVWRIGSLNELERLVSS
jgi:putative hydrolase of the HAD superfamily